MFKFLTASLLVVSAVMMAAQNTEPVLPPPMAPEQIIYRHWPEQFVQWIGPELPYTMIELYVDPGSSGTPLYEAVLTERATGKRVHYSNQQQMVDITSARARTRTLRICSSTARQMRARALPIYCDSSITQASRCRGNGFKVLT